VFYEPGELGFEKKIKERLAYWDRLNRGKEEISDEVLGGEG
jgi:hypothetical protein